MKRIIAIVLALALTLCCTTSAFALTGTVQVSTWLNLRKAASTSAGIRAYMQNGTVVTILDNGNKTNGFYYIYGYGYADHDTWSDGAYHYGWGHSDYIH